MKLKNYKFGHVESEENDSFDNDLIVMGDWIHNNWWRNDGHRLVPDDLKDLIPQNPSKLVIGQGASSQMKLSPKVKQFLEDQEIDFEAMPTEQAIKRYNELADEDEQVAGAFHLTC